MIDPYYQDEWVKIYNADCRNVISDIDSCDALVTDPPFGIAWSRATWSDNPLDYDELMKWLIKESNRIIVNGWCFCFQAMPNVSRFHEWFPEGWRIFAACKNFAQIRKTGVWHSWDPVVFWHNGPNTGPNTNHVNRDYFVGNTAGVFGIKNGHPCPKPIDTMRHIVQLAVSDGGIVLDPFAGSGTTGRAAKDTGRRAILIEMEERYCEIAAKRMSQDMLF